MARKALPESQANKDPKENPESKANKDPKGSPGKVEEEPARPLTRSRTEERMSRERSSSRPTGAFNRLATERIGTTSWEACPLDLAEDHTPV
jgi:hypothetical protein